jgi:hypothetical protein
MEYIGGESGILVIAALLVFALIVVPRIRRMDTAGRGEESRALA